ncbi:MAG: hypothetical protein HGA65_07060 [Oscillochloris sp.]|nr:hypothetical protein [Oscillochloris sp.]
MQPRSTPLARRIAQAYSIDLAGLHGSACDGRILAADVRRAAAQACIGLTAATLVPIASVSLELDASAALRQTTDLGDQIATAVGKLLARHPAINASWSAAGILRHRQIRLPGAAAKTERPTFGVVSLTEGVWLNIPPIPPGAVAALGVGALRRQAVVYEGGVAIRPVVLITLSYDARAVDHNQAVAFLHDLRQTVEGV